VNDGMGRIMGASPGSREAPAHPSLPDTAEETTPLSDESHTLAEVAAWSTA